MKWISVDQSLSHCAIVVWDDGKVIDREMVRTGSNSSKGPKKPTVVYFDTVTEQIYHIACALFQQVKKHGAEFYVMEALSFGSVGNATRDLAGLFYVIQVMLYDAGLLRVDEMHSIAPTSVKSFARHFLLPEDQVEYKKKVDKKTGKEVQSKAKNAMKKPAMVKACEQAMPGWLDGITLEAGKADYADAYFIGRCYWEALSAKGK